MAARNSARRPGRYLAPVALVLFSVGVYVIVHDNLATHAAPAPAARTGTAARPHSTRPRRPSKFYVVKPGDVLGRIAAHNGLTLAELEALNPSLDPNSLQNGQRLRLRR